MHTYMYLCDGILGAGMGIHYIGSKTFRKSSATIRDLAQQRVRTPHEQIVLEQSGAWMLDSVSKWLGGLGLPVDRGNLPLDH